MPPTQVADTVELFWIPGRRKLSLRFLAAVLLKINIQTEVHDSIEDARTALQLFERFRALKAEGKVDETLQELYRIGRASNWQVTA